ncbi:MAG: MscL family protein, partial [Acholeplasmatales bacterium]|nr:MscL family protein [Acholeplasmatales bacterium]
MKKFFGEFKAFIARGNVLDMAVGVVIGGAFSAIVTALVNILLSVCTWAVPGGLKGLVTILPAVNDAQRGVAGIGQSFQAADIVEATKAFAAAQGATIDVSDAAFPTWQAALLSKYTLHGTTYTYNMSAVIDWGTFINAIISFIIVAFVLFLIVKAFNKLKEAQEKAKAKVEAKLAKKTEEV